MIFGMDVSRWQGGNVDFHRARAEGVEFAIIRCWDRATNAVDMHFHRNLRAAREAGMVVAAYHFIAPWETGEINADRVLRTVPADCPVILDVERDGNGQGADIHKTWDVTNRLRTSGRVLPLLYLPRWWWEQLGRPDLRGLAPALWSSRYVNNLPGAPGHIFGRVPAEFWNGYGGLNVAVLQFSDESTIAGHTPVDANAFGGTRPELEHTLQGDDMFTERDQHNLIDIAEQFSGSRQPGQFPGWENLVNGNKETLTDYIRFIASNSWKIEGKEAGQAAAISALATALRSGSVNSDEVVTKVREAVRTTMTTVSVPSQPTGENAPAEPTP